MNRCSESEQFIQEDAAAFRRALNDTYAKAVEAAEKGDVCAQNAIKMLRAARPR